MSTNNDAPASMGRTVLATAAIGIVACGAAAAAFTLSLRYVREAHAGPVAETAVIILYGAAVIAIAAWLARLGQRMLRMTPSRPARRYRRRFMIAMSLYVLAMAAAIEGYLRLQPRGALAYALAILPALPLMGAIAAMGFYLKEETDEFERSVQAEAALWATGGLLAAATVWGFLEMFGLAPHLEVWLAFPAWAAFLAPGQILARGRYR